MKFKDLVEEVLSENKEKKAVKLLEAALKNVIEAEKINGQPLYYTEDGGDAYVVEGIEQALEYFKNEELFTENSTEDAAGTLKAVIGALKKRDNLDDKGKDVLKTAEGIMDYYNKNKSFSPGQAKAIFNMSKILK